MTVTYNNQIISIEPSQNIECFVKQRFDSVKGIAVALNETIVSKTLWSETHLKPNDKILIITATQGG